MANNENYAWVDLANKGSVELRVPDLGTFPLVQFSMTYALNEIPRAAGLTAVGRDVRTLKKAPIHKYGGQLKQMYRASVWFTPSGDWNTSHDVPWEGGKYGNSPLNKPKCIFDGYYVGMGYTKMNDKVHAVLHLINWMCDLGFSSTLSANSHPTNPGSLLQYAVDQPTMGAGIGGQPAYISDHSGMSDVYNMVSEDLWQGIKEMLCNLTDVDKFHLDCGGGCASGSGDYRDNSRALRALKRMEGPAPKAEGKLAYHYGKPMQFDTQNVSLVADAIAEAVCYQRDESFIHTTFWDQIIGNYCASFSMTVVPLVDRALVVADCPAYRTPWIKSLEPDDYESFELSGMINRPLQGVGVYGDYASQTNWQISAPADGNHVCLGGSYSVDAQSGPGDGMWLVVPNPLWLSQVPHVGLYGGASSGISQEEASNSASTPDETSEPEDTQPNDITDLCSMYSAYAQSIYIENMLRGRRASITSKLRFDISPGSIVLIKSKGDVVMPGSDAMACDMYGHVERVSFNINAEARLASTVFEMSHIRTEAENQDPRTSVDAHPLFKDPIFNGAPMNATSNPTDNTIDEAWLFRDK